MGLLERLGTGTTWGTTRWSVWEKCQYLYWLTYHERARFEDPEEIKLETGLDVLAVGTLCHGVLDYAHQCVLKGKSEAKIKAWVGLVDQWRKEEPALEPEIDECERLMEAYWLKWGFANAGWKGFKLVASELELGSEEERRTTQADVLVEDPRGDLWVVDHKSRAQKAPEDFVHSSAVNPQFLRTAMLTKAKTGREIVGTIVNVIVKTKIPKFARYDVPWDDEVIEDYTRASQVRDAEIRAFEALISGRKDKKKNYSLPVKNFSSCAPTFGMKCRAFDVCHPSIKDLKP